MAAMATMSTKPGVGAMSRTGSSKGTYKRNGETLAIPHKPAHIFQDASKSAALSTAMASFKDPNQAQPMIAYEPNALRNRLPVEFKGAATPCQRFCAPRNNHTYDFMNPGGSAKPPGFNPYKTTSQNFFDYDVNMLDVGESNQGIVSEKASTLHKRQLN